MLCVRRRIRRPSQHDGTVVAPATGRRVRDVVSPETLLATCCSRRPPSCRRCRTILGVRDHGPWPVGPIGKGASTPSCREPDRCAGGQASPRTSTRAPIRTCPSRCRRKGYPGEGRPSDCGCKRLRTEDRVCALRIPGLTIGSSKTFVSKSHRTFPLPGELRSTSDRKGQHESIGHHHSLHKAGCV
jgi:hypothetical protein